MVTFSVVKLVETRDTTKKGTVRLSEYRTQIVRSLGKNEHFAKWQ